MGVCVPTYICTYISRKNTLHAGSPYACGAMLSHESNGEESTEQQPFVKNFVFYKKGITMFLIVCAIKAVLAKKSNVLMILLLPLNT